MRNAGLKYAFFLLVFAAAVSVCFASSALAVKPISFGMNVSQVKIGEGTDGSQFWSIGKHGIKAEGGRVYAVWAHSILGHGVIFFTKSLDGGDTWSGAKVVSMTQTGEHYYAAGIAIDQAVNPANDVIHVVWDRNDIDEMYSVSTNGGNNWSVPIAVNRDPYINIDGTWSVSVALDESTAPDSTVHVVWISDSDHLYDSASTNNGQSWVHTDINIPTQSNQNADVAINGAGDIMVAWEHSNGVSFAKSTTGGSSWPLIANVTSVKPGASTSIAADPSDSSRVYVAYPDYYSNSIYCAYSDDGGINWHPVTVASDNGDTSVAVGPNGGISVVWNNKMSRSTDHGASWLSAPISYYGGQGYYPHIAIDDNGMAHIMFANDAARYTREQ